MQDKRGSHFTLDMKYIVTRESIASQRPAIPT
jgi:hypothetical protein